ncbi:MULTISPECIES: response regulator [unclassified Achromobacter]|jgi:two-component system, LuxR family, response regulator FixJ|uniref:response regulator n=1 Tax=unclassified Achromobacter TaxID=2626865 RepID=UPI000B51A80A|nr:MULTISPECIES: response regulator [unclassified Achromobacter]OWT71508.1 response regulator [Achromobacter sp. HZ34]OWT73165.1 response regulator [Achromobacter sp. HZ28]
MTASPRAAAPIIAIVDDDASVRMALGRLLRSIDLDVRLYDGGQALLNDTQAGTLDCVVTDVRMPGVSGFDLCQSLRKRGFAMPIVFMTAHLQEGYAERAQEVGAACFLQKPFADTELIACIEQAVGRSSGDD